MGVANVINPMVFGANVLNKIKEKTVNISASGVWGTYNTYTDDTVEMILGVKSFEFSHSNAYRSGRCNVIGTNQITVGCDTNTSNNISVGFTVTYSYLEKSGGVINRLLKHLARKWGVCDE